MSLAPRAVLQVARLPGEAVMSVVACPWWPVASVTSMTTATWWSTAVSRTATAARWWSTGVPAAPLSASGMLDGDVMTCCTGDVVAAGGTVAGGGVADVWGWAVSQRVGACEGGVAAGHGGGEGGGVDVVGCAVASEDGERGVGDGGGRAVAGGSARVLGAYAVEVLTLVASTMVPVGWLVVAVVHVGSVAPTMIVGLVVVDGACGLCVGLAVGLCGGLAVGLCVRAGRYVTEVGRLVLDVAWWPRQDPEALAWAGPPCNVVVPLWAGPPAAIP